MMVQNRQEEKDRKRSEIDYLINLKSELELKNLYQKIHLLLEDQIKTLFESQATGDSEINSTEVYFNEIILFCICTYTPNCITNIICNQQ